MKITKLLLGAAAIATVLTASVSAQNIPVTITGLAPGVSGILTTYNHGTPELQDAGVLQTSVGNAFCVEPGVRMDFPSDLVYTTTNISDLSSNDVIAKLVGGYLASSQSSLDAAAVQLLIWEVLLDGSVSGSILNGNMAISGDTDPALLSRINQFVTGYSTGPGYTAVPITYLINTGEGIDHRQNIITWSTVPEPSSMLLLGLTSLVFFRRKR